jgi:TRAP transporter TAXI family solute receptor
MLKSFFLLTFLSLFAFSAPLKIASSPKGTSYYVLAQSISNVEKIEKKQEILPVATNGSVENIKLLLEKKVDLAIVQNDIAFFAKNAHQPFINQHNNLQLILPLFKEPIFVITNKKGINSLTQLRNRKIAIGDKESGLSESAKVILNSINILDSMQIYQVPESLALTKLQEDSFDAIFVNNLTEELKDKINEEKLFIVPISKTLVHKLKNTFPYFETHKFTLKNQEIISTIAVRSILITRSDLDVQTVYSIIQLLTKHYNDLIFPDAYHTNLNELFRIDTQLDWHEGVKKYFTQHKIITSSDQIFNKYFWYISIASVFFIVVFIFVLILTLYKLGWLNRLPRNQAIISLLQKMYFYSFKYKYLLLLSFIVLSYSIAVLIIKYFEHSWAIEHNVISIFDENPFVESSLWLFIFGATGYNGDFFPNSSEGKLLVSLIPMFGLGGFFALIGFITSDQIKKYILEAKGMAKINFNKHIIICGWNDKTKLLIENLTHDNLSVKKDLVILADNLDFNPIEKYNFNSQFVKYVAGAATSRESLDKANIQEASTAIIVSDNNSSDPDARTILSVLAIERYCDDLAESGIRDPKNDIYTIAEIVDPNNTQTARDARVDQVISLGDIESKIFTQSVQNPGVIKFIDEIFTYDDFNDIYSFSIAPECKLIGKNYDEILLLLRKHEILLLSINIEANRTPQETRKVCQNNNLNRSVITNPINVDEKNYKLMKNDLLIVLAKYEKRVTQALQSIKKEL